MALLGQRQITLATVKGFGSGLVEAGEKRCFKELSTAYDRRKKWIYFLDHVARTVYKICPLLRTFLNNSFFLLTILIVPTLR